MKYITLLLCIKGDKISTNVRKYLMIYYYIIFYKSIEKSPYFKKNNKHYSFIYMLLNTFILYTLNVHNFRFNF